MKKYFLFLLLFPIVGFAFSSSSFTFVPPFRIQENVLSLRYGQGLEIDNGVLIVDDTFVGTTTIIGATSTPGGSDSYIQYNDSGVFGGENNLVWDDVNNRLGIGTSSPLATLQVLGQVSVGTTSPFDSNTGIQYYRQDNGFAHIMARSINSGSGSRAAMLAHSNAAQVQFIAHGSGITTSRWGVTLGGYGEINGFAPTFGLIVGMVNDVPVIMGNNSIERMRIHTGGNIGINDTTPDSELDVNGRVSVDGDVYVTASTRGIILKSPDGTCARGVISNLDVLSFTSVSCPF